LENLTDSRLCRLASKNRAINRSGPITNIVAPTVIKMADVGLSLDPFCKPRVVFFASVDVEFFSAIDSPSSVP
jgi:hypothetical protein